jgi:hypothetical protein
MAIDEHVETFAGRPIVNFEPGGALPDTQGHAVRVSLDYDAFSAGTRLTDVLAELLEARGAGDIRALIIGAWDFESSNDSAPIVELLTSAAGRLPALEALFLGDITVEEQEISWIQQSDISPLFVAFPKLKVLRVRGATGLYVGTIRHEALEELAFESGGLPRQILRAVSEAELPNLKHLELWLGDSSYGWDGSIADLAPLLDGQRFPKLRTLGLKDSEIQDAVAQAVAASPLLDRLEVLDLSMGVLTDDGARALLAAAGLHKLRRLDIHHHYVSEGLVAELAKVVPEVDASDVQDPGATGGDRYVAVAE